MSRVDWQGLLFKAAGRLVQQLEALARRRFPADSTTADEAFNAVLESLSHDDWKRSC